MPRTLFASALLLFAVQPMFTKMVLPRLGGAPSVWSVAMVAFQAVLFIGYVYAHVLTRTLAPARAALVHLGFLALAAPTLPLGIAKGFDAPPADGVMLWLVGLFAASIGLPFVALVGERAAAAELVHRHRASAGAQSLCALRRLEPRLVLRAAGLSVRDRAVPDAARRRRVLWSVGFAVLAVLICVAALIACAAADGLSRSRRRERAPADASAVGVRPPGPCSTAMPAGLVIAVTAYITTDLAAAPFLWVLPLALYLLTFVAVFRERPWIPHALVLRLLPYVVAPLAISCSAATRCTGSRSSRSISRSSC